MIISGFARSDAFEIVPARQADLIFCFLRCQASRTAKKPARLDQP
jgi:hypothetical protein